MSHTENLLRLMNLPPSRFKDVTRTSDGFYLAMVQGDCGFNAFLGKPNPIHNGPGLESTMRVWESLDAGERVLVSHAAASRNVDLADFLPSDCLTSR